MRLELTDDELERLAELLAKKLSERQIWVSPPLPTPPNQEWWYPGWTPQPIVWN